jgi:hypothetical protein
MDIINKLWFILVNNKLKITCELTSGLIPGKTLESELVNNVI